MGFCCVEFKFVPTQAKVTPAVGEFPNSCTLGVAHVKGPPLEAVAPGGVVFWPTVVVAVLVQPFATLVTVTVYVPDKETLGAWRLEEKPLGPAQENVGDATLVILPKVIEGALQVIVPPTVATVGGVMFSVTTAVMLDVQPVAGSVTVRI
jgi:hypothetical protein